MNLKAPKEVTRAHLPSLINSIIAVTSLIELLVKADANDASSAISAILTSD